METIVVDVLRTPETQRLRRVKQLGLAHFVFPSAEHSRLVHSLGAANVAIRFGRHLRESSRGTLTDFLIPDESAIRDLALAALFHDLGHGPLSHAWEREIVGEKYDFPAWVKTFGLEAEADALKGMKWHELVAQAMLADEGGKLHRLLESHEAGTSKRLRLLLQGKYYIPYLSKLLSSDVDVDRADFLKRDTHLSGVAYGRYDLDWLISTCCVGNRSNGDLVLGFDQRKSVRVIEQFLIARRALYETLYYHKTVRSAEGMVAKFLHRLREVSKADGHISRGIEITRPLLRIISGETLEVRELLSLDDFALWVLIENVARNSESDPTAQDLAKRILARDLFKLVPCASEKVSDFILNKTEAPIHEVIRKFCPGDPSNYLIVDHMNFKMLSENETQMSYFIDNDRRASFVRDHESLRHDWKKAESSIRLFTIREAVDSVKKLIEG